MKNILITGGSGFIGSEIVRQLNNMNEWNIIVLDAMTEQIHGQIGRNHIFIKKLRINVFLLKVV